MAVVEAKRSHRRIRWAARAGWVPQRQRIPRPGIPRTDDLGDRLGASLLDGPDDRRDRSVSSHTERAVILDLALCRKGFVCRLYLSPAAALFVAQRVFQSSPGDHRLPDLWRDTVVARASLRPRRPLLALLRASAHQMGPCAFSL